MGSFLDLIRRLFKLAIGHLQLGKLQDLGIAAGQQRIEQVARVASGKSRMRRYAGGSGKPSS